jgi:DtxR family Mn-dependent transcriptional regulator
MKKPGELKRKDAIPQLAENLSASLEDYIQVIFRLEESNRVARAKEIAERMDVQRASVTGALKALAGRGLINYSPYRHITLTAEGRRIAQDIVRRHNTLKEFFIATLQLDAQEAEANACRIEHAIDAVAVDRLVHFLEFLRLCPRTNLEWLDGFALYCQRGAQGTSCKECLKDCLEQID